MPKQNSDIHLHMMQKAIALAEKGRITAPPNPWVGCLITKEGKIIGEGYHHAAGQPHAEINALNNCIASPEGATVYLTLEPCAHYGRTPPCTEALIKAGVKKVIIAQQDPDPKVAGKGFSALLQAGIEVELGIGAKEAQESLKPYLWQREKRTPFCLAKMAVSIDGRIAAADGSSKWISSPEALKDVHKLRAESQAILIGADTALHDNPSLTVREHHTHPLKPPTRVIIDPKGKLATPSLLTTPLFNLSLAPTLIYTSPTCNGAAKTLWQQNGIEVVEIKEITPHKLSLKEILLDLGKRDIIQLLLEGGGKLLSSFYKEKLINELTLYIGATILGDKGIPLFSDLNIFSMKEAPKLHLKSSTAFGETIRLQYELVTIQMPPPQSGASQ